ncbi:MAG: hypothetical protein ACP6IP_06480 [Candidatus Njordarchaeia archaeon]
MSEYIKVININIVDPIFFIEQFELFLNSRDILNMVGDEEIKIDRLSFPILSQAQLSIVGSIRGKIGYIEIKPLVQPNLMSKGTLTKQEKGVIMPPNAAPQIPALPSPTTQDSVLSEPPLVSDRETFIASIYLLKKLPLEFVEIVKAFVQRYRDFKKPGAII